MQGPVSRLRGWRGALIGSMGLLVGLLTLYAMGPRSELDLDPGPATPVIPNVDVLDVWLARNESTHPTLVTGAEKRIVWAGKPGERTPLAVIYLHGYTATRQEVAPLCERLAASLGANLYHTRLHGHGLDPEALGAATAEDWLRDAAEALAIGRTLGERVIVVGTSTGGTLALWLAQQESAESIAAMLLISPNLGPRNRQGELLAGPWGAELLSGLVGDTYEWQPANDAQRRYWTWRYPARALLPMMALVREVRDSPLESIRLPTYVLYSPDDRVVHPDEIERAFSRLGSPIKTLESFPDAQDRSRHVLAGDILAPQDTSRVLERMQRFLSRLDSVPRAQPSGCDRKFCR